MNPTSEPQREIARFVESPGIVAAQGRQGTENVLLFASTGLPITDEDRSYWETLFDAGWAAMDKARAQDPSTVEIRLLLNDNTVLFHQEGDLRIGVAFAKGAPVVKSLPRMIRKAYRRLGKPTAPPTPRSRPTVQSSGSLYYQGLEKTPTSF